MTATITQKRANVERVEAVVPTYRDPPQSGQR